MLGHARKLTAFLLISFVSIFLIACNGSGDETSSSTSVISEEPQVTAEALPKSTGTSLAVNDQAAGSNQVTSTNEESDDPADSLYEQSDFVVSDVSAQTYQGRLAAAVTFSTPLPSDQLFNDWLSVTTDDQESLSGEWAANDTRTVLYFPGLSPDETYHINVRKGLPSAFGKSLESDKTVSFTTDTLEPMVGFLNQGNLLAHQLTKGLPVLTVNVSQVDLDFYRIPESKLYDFLSENSGRGQLDFWRVRDSLKQFDLVYTGRFDLKVLENQQATRYIPVKSIAPLQKPGVYLTVMKPAGSYDYQYPSTWFAVTDLGVQLKIFKDQIDVHVNSLASADEKEGVHVTLLDAEGGALADQVTNKEGVVSFERSALKTEPKLLLAQSGKDTTLVKLFGPALDLSEFPVTGHASHQQTLFLYSSRDLYRPGESVTVSGLLRGADGDMVNGATLEASLQQPDGRIVATRRLAASALNYYEVTFPITNDAPTGQWRITMTLPDSRVVEYPIQVEDFLPERMTLDLKAPEQLSLDSQYKLDVDGQYLYGAPATGNKLQSKLIASMEPHPFRAFEAFHFGDIQQTELDRQVDLDPLVLNGEGKATVSVPSFWQEAKVPLRLKLFESLLDTGGRPVSRSVTSTVMPADELIGIRPLFEQGTVDYGSTANFELVVTNGVDKFARQGVTVQLIREHRQYHWVYSDSDGWSSNYTERHYPVFSQIVDINADSSTSISVPVEWGYYRLEIKDPSTNLVSNYRFNAGWSEQSQTLSGRPDRIGMSLDKQKYMPGDKVKVRLQPPAAGKGWLIVEGDKPLHSQPIDIPADGGAVEFTMSPEWKQHDLYISVTLLQAGQEREEHLPRRMMGIQPLPLDREDRRLTVSLELPERALPEKQLTIPVKVSTSSGKLPSAVQMTLSAVDMGVLNITRFKTPDPFVGLFGQRAYSPQVRDSYGELVDGDEGALAELRFGGDADLQRGGTEAPSDVQIVSLFSGVIPVDEQGNAEIPLNMPDFNGRVRLMAVAFGENHVGSAEAELQVAAPVVTQLSMPRFLAIGDQSELALDLHNLSGSEQQMTIEVTLGEGLESSEGASPLTKAITLADQEKTTLRIPVKATEVFGRTPIVLQVTGLTNLPQGSDHSFTRQWTLSSRPAWPSITEQWQKRLAPEKSLVLSKTTLNTLIPSSATLAMSASSRPPLNLASYLRALKAYPYGCLEQTTSGMFAQIYTDPALLLELGLTGESNEHREETMRVAIQRLMGMQNSSGGFGLWGADSPEEYWLTVYVTDFLLRAQQAGYDVPAHNVERSVKRLQSYVRDPRRISSEYTHDDSVTRFAVRSYAALVLADLGQASLSDLRTIYDQRGDKWNGLGLLQLGMALDTAGDSTRAQAALASASERLLSSTWRYSDYGSRVRDLALAVFMSIEHHQPAEFWEPLLYRLKEQLTKRRWLSTQEQNALFLAGRQLQIMGGEPLALTLLQGAGTSAIQSEGDWREQRSGTSAVGDLTLINAGDRPVYVDIQLRGYPKNNPKAQSNGIRVQRRYFDANGNALQPLHLATGDMVIVELTAKTDDPMPHALIVDLLPAGLELENQNLATSLDMEDLKIGGQSIVELMQQQDIRHQEFRDDRYVAAVNINWSRESKLYYLARAVSPGTFVIPPTFAQDMYKPDYRHIGGQAGKVTVQVP